MLSELIVRHRAKIDVIGIILNVANGGASKSEIYYRSFLSYSKLKKYLYLLIENGLIEYVKEQNVYKTTCKGMCLLEAYSGMIELIEGITIPIGSTTYPIDSNIIIHNAQEHSPVKESELSSPISVISSYTRTALKNHDDKIPVISQ
jgi:predicted transcriptional regulator